MVLRVTEYIATGLDQQLIDPDGGANVERKRQRLQTMGLGTSSAWTPKPRLRCASAGERGGGNL